MDSTPRDNKIDLVAAIREKVAKKSKADSTESIPVTSVLQQAAQSVLSSHDIVAASELGDEAISLYTIDRKSNVITSLSDLQAEFLINRTYPGLKQKERKEVLNFLKFESLANNAINLDLVQPVAFADELDVTTWNRLSVSKRDVGNVSLADLPGFTHVISLCDDPDALVLWIGSLLDPKSARVQYLHWHGGGGNGKSTLFQGIAKVLGEKHVVYTRADDFNSTHWGTQVEGARLLLFTEENSGSLFSSAKFKEFTGEDYTTVNPKYKQARRLQLTHKTAVLSNTKVIISDNAADKRRLLSVSSQPDPDPNIGSRWWYDELKNQGEKILVYCYQQYQLACESDPSYRAYIPPSDEAMQAAIDRKYAEITDVILDNYVITKNEDHIVKRSTLHKTIAEELKEKRNNRMFLQQLGEALTRLGITTSTQHGGVQIYRGLKPSSGLENVKSSTESKVIK